MGTSFKFEAPNGIPRMIRRGEDTTLDVTWFEDNAAIVGTVVSATFTLKQGSTVLVDSVAATTFGGPIYSATYDLNGTTTATRPFSDTILEVWTLTNLVGDVVTARRSGHLVRNILYPMVTDSDLVARHARIEDIRPPTVPNFSTYIETAWEMLNRDLIKRGRRPELVLDSYALIDMHIFKTLELVFKDASTYVGDGRYHELMSFYAAEYREEWTTIQFRYDRGQDGAIDDAQLEAATPSIWLGEPPPGFPSSVVKDV